MGLVPYQQEKPMAVPVQSRYIQCNVRILSNRVEMQGCVVVRWAKSYTPTQKTYI